MRLSAMGAAFISRLGLRRGLLPVTLRLKRKSLLPKKLQAGIDNCWVINGTASSFNLLQREVNPQCRAIRPVRGHRLKHIRNRQDSRPRQNLVSLEPLRVCLLYTSDAADDLLCVDLGG